MKHIARKSRLTFRWAEVEDYLAESQLLLVKAANSFDPSLPNASFKKLLFIILQHGFVEWCNRNTIISFSQKVKRDQGNVLTRSKYLNLLMWKARHPKQLEVDLVATEGVDQITLGEALGLISKMNADDRYIMERLYELNGRESCGIYKLADELGVKITALKLRHQTLLSQMRQSFGESPPAKPVDSGSRRTFSSAKVAKVFDSLSLTYQQVCGPFYGIMSEQKTVEQIATDIGQPQCYVTKILKRANTQIGHLLVKSSAVGPF